MMCTTVPDEIEKLIDPNQPANAGNIARKISLLQLYNELYLCLCTVQCIHVIQGTYHTKHNGFSSNWLILLKNPALQHYHIKIPYLIWIKTAEFMHIKSFSSIMSAVFEFNDSWSSLLILWNCHPGVLNSDCFSPDIHSHWVCHSAEDNENQRCAKCLFKIILQSISHDGHVAPLGILILVL